MTEREDRHGRGLAGWRLTVALCLLALAGCYRSAVRGAVVDFEGETLPGVAVSVEDTAFQDVTNGVGRYSVRYYPGTVRLHFSKTGYTPSVLELEAGGPWPVDAPNVVLWHLPINRGVFFFVDGHYIATAPVEPRRFARGIYGTEWMEEAVIRDRQPRLLAHKLPSDGAALVRMKFVEAVPEDSETGEPVEIWAPEVEVPVRSIPIDQPEHLLVDLKYEGELEPGTYAVHWGALAGNREPVPSSYLFTIESELPAPSAEAASDEAGEEDPEPEAAAEPEE